VPVVLVLKDLCWADQATLDLVIFLARRIESMPTLLLPLSVAAVGEVAATAPRSSTGSPEGIRSISQSASVNLSARRGPCRLGRGRPLPR
jgi:hypothetical protein